MGYYGIECPTCKGPAILFSFNMSISCGTCDEKLKNIGPETSNASGTEDKTSSQGFTTGNVPDAK